MPSQKPTVTFRADSPEQHARWKASAEAAGMTFNEFAVAALDAVTAGVEAEAVRPRSRLVKPHPAAVRKRTGSGTRTKSKAREPRTGACEHGVPESSFCKQGCDG